MAKAVARAAENLGITNVELDQNLKKSDFALLFVEMFNSLLASVGDEPTAIKWLHSENLGLNGKPIDLIFSTAGLLKVIEYIDHNRGQ